MVKCSILLHGLPSHHRKAYSCDVGACFIMEFLRITADQHVMAGVPCIRSLRIPVATVVGMVADGMSVGEILVAYPDLEREDIGEALRFAAEAVREQSLPLITMSA